LGVVLMAYECEQCFASSTACLILHVCRCYRLLHVGGNPSAACRLSRRIAGAGKSCAGKCSSAFLTRCVPGEDFHCRPD
jgi:hypothetical protein